MYPNELISRLNDVVDSDLIETEVAALHAKYPNLASDPAVGKAIELAYITASLRAAQLITTGEYNRDY